MKLKIYYWNWYFTPSGKKAHARFQNHQALCGIGFFPGTDRPIYRHVGDAPWRCKKCVYKIEKYFAT